MKKQVYVLLTCAVLLIAFMVGLVWTAKKTATLSANAPIKSGVSLDFGRSLNKEAVAEFKDSEGNVIKNLRLEASGNIFNVELKPGVYQVSVWGAENSFAPTPPITATVSEGVVQTVRLVVPLSAEQ